jgi:hypothetical protein
MRRIRYPEPDFKKYKDLNVIFSKWYRVEKKDDKGMCSTCGRRRGKHYGDDAKFCLIGCGSYTIKRFPKKTSNYELIRNIKKRSYIVDDWVKVEFVKQVKMFEEYSNKKKKEMIEEILK